MTNKFSNFKSSFKNMTAVISTSGAYFLKAKRDITQEERKQEAQELSQNRKRVMREFIFPYTPMLLVALTFMALGGLAGSAVAVFIKPLIDDIFVNGNLDYVYYVSIGVTVAYLLKGVFLYLGTLINTYIGTLLLLDLQKRMYSNLFVKDISFFDKKKSGEIISLFGFTSGNLQSAASEVILLAGRDFFSLISLIGVMFYHDFFITLMIFFVGFPIIGLVYFIARRVRDMLSTQQKGSANLQHKLQESFINIRAVKAYNMENNIVEDLNKTVHDLQKTALGINIGLNITRPSMEIIAGFMVGIVILYGGLQVANNSGEAGSFFGLITATLLAYQPAKNLAFLSAKWAIVGASAKILYSILDIKPKITDSSDAIAEMADNPEIELKNVVFSYESDADAAPSLLEDEALKDGAEQKLALNGVSIKIPYGKHIALVGQSGSGKSTIFSLLLRLYDVDGGEVVIGGHNIKDYKQSMLRDEISYVSQDAILFNDTIANNIKIGKKDASQEEIIAAAKVANAHEFIMQTPQGYETVLGEMGSGLSGGQKQRIVIARAALKNSKILLLDEATSALDSHSEVKIQEALKNISQNKTSITIAHRLSTIISSDVIYVLRDGVVIEEGSHNELIAKGGAYKDLYNMQYNNYE